MSVLKTFSKTFVAKLEVPIASLIAFSASASFFNSAISSTTYQHSQIKVGKAGYERGYRLKSLRCGLLRGLLPRRYRKVE